MCAVPISTEGNSCGRVCTSQSALTDQLDLVAVGNAPITVDLVGFLGPVMVKTLLGSCLINEVTSDWTCKSAKSKCSNDDGCKDGFTFDHVVELQWNICVLRMRSPRYPWMY